MAHPAYEEAIRGEVSRWPGASVSFSARAKHDQATISFAGVSRFVVIPSSPGDMRRGPANSISNVRSELQRLGAMRASDPPKTMRRKRVRNAVERDMFANIERAPRRENPFAVLAALKAAPVKPEPRWLSAIIVLTISAIASRFGSPTHD